MSNKKITVQDIADKLNISRNTVSKALNNTGNISENTKSKVIQAAIEMGYKQFSYINTTSIKETPTRNKEIALFTCNMPNSSHFGSNLLSGFENIISNEGFRLSMYMVRENELKTLTLPINFDSKSVYGIICIEMFDHDYSNLICDLNIPTLFIDSSIKYGSDQLNADILLMENHNSVYTLTKSLIDNNISNIGFVGDNYHCQSFYERWQGYRSALFDSGIPVTNKNSILENDKNPYASPEWFKNKFEQLESFPEAFICANDFIAISLIKALKEINISVPNDLLVCGFDDSQESKIFDPKLTTVNIPSYDMGGIAANLLLTRITKPTIPFRTVHVKTSIKYRETTGTITK